MYDVAIIGCGVIGAAAAYALSRYDNKVVILEAENDVADCTTKANSAILHAGYDPAPGTRMARLNVRGVALAKEICAKLDVSYKQCGSLVLALDEKELPHLQHLFENGTANGVPDMKILSREETLAMEPNLSEKVCGACVAACKNGSAMLFVSAKVSQLNLLPQGKPEALRRAKAMLSKMDELGFGNCTNTRACEAECPKNISISNIARLNRDFIIAKLKD